MMYTQKHKLFDSVAQNRCEKGHNLTQVCVNVIFLVLFTTLSGLW